MSQNLVKTKTTLGRCSSGSLLPVLAIHITPMYWQLSFVWQATDGIPSKMGLGIGPIAVALNLGSLLEPPHWEAHCELNSVTAISKRKAEHGRET